MYLTCTSSAVNYMQERKMRIKPKSSSSTAMHSWLSDILTEALEKQGAGIIDLAKKLDISYEHARRFVRGESVPSTIVLKEICAYLKLPFEELNVKAKADRMQKDYGNLPLVLAGKNPTLEPLDRVWNDLTEAQQQDIINMARAWAKRERAS